jgi:hypothetical protein
MRRIVLASALAGLAACSDSPSGLTTGGSASGGPTSTPTPSVGTISGTALDTKGQPLANVLVWVEPALTTGLLKARTDGAGRYSVTGLAQLPYYALAWTEVSYRGKSYCLRLASARSGDYDSFVPSSAVTRDFRWQLTGPIPDVDDQYFGGEVRLQGDGSAPASDSVEVRFTPTGPLIDGSAGRTITRTTSAYGMIQDVPAGPYTASATLIAPGGKRSALKVGRAFGAGADAMPLEFDPITTPSCSSGSGLARAFIYWTYPGGA